MTEMALSYFVYKDTGIERLTTMCTVVHAVNARARIRASSDQPETGRLHSTGRPVSAGLALPHDVHNAQHSWPAARLPSMARASGGSKGDEDTAIL